MIQRVSPIETDTGLAISTWLSALRGSGGTLFRRFHSGAGRIGAASGVPVTGAAARRFWLAIIPVQLCAAVRFDIVFVRPGRIFGCGRTIAGGISDGG